MVNLDLKERCFNFFGNGLMWPAIEASYSEPHRAYHTLEHLRYMFSLFDSCEFSPYNNEIELAIWFHDLVYDTGELYSNNEENSVQSMIMLCDLYSDRSFNIAVACEFIRATKSHTIANPDSNIQEACILFLDIDLMILSDTNEITDKFDDQIRFEFKQYNDHDFAHGRIQALKHLQANTLYHSKFFSYYESFGKDNLAYLINKWEHKLNDNI